MENMNNQSMLPFCGCTVPNQVTCARCESHFNQVHRQLYHLWEYINGEGLWFEAREYVEDHRDEPTPYEW